MASFCVTIFDTIENATAADACFGTSINNLDLNKGSSYRIVYQLSKSGGFADIVGYSVRGKIKPTQASNTVLLDLSTSNLLFRLDPANSRIIMNIPESFTSSISETVCFYYIELLNPGGESFRIVQGQMTINN